MAEEHKVFSSRNEPQVDRINMTTRPSREEKKPTKFLNWERDFRQTIRERHLSWKTEVSYIQWARRFVKFVYPLDPNAARAKELNEFLKHLAEEKKLSPSARIQARNVLICFLEDFLKVNLDDQIESIESQKTTSLPNLLSLEECDRLISAMDGIPRLMAGMCYGSGLRGGELLRLRIRDLDLQRLLVFVREGLNIRHRVTVFPRVLLSDMETHLDHLATLHLHDRESNLPGVWLPHRLASSHPEVGKEFGWQWLFPSRHVLSDPKTGIHRRHHASQATLLRSIRSASRGTGINKTVTPKLLRHCFAVHLLRSGAQIRNIQELLGNTDAHTAKVYRNAVEKQGTI